MIDKVGFIKTSLCDYPGEIASVIFTLGCNLKCPYCQNPTIADGSIDETKLYRILYVLGYLDFYHGKITAVSITGGEPTIHEGLCRLVRQLKTRKLKVKIDTNGTNLHGLKKCKDVDLVNMSIKHDFLKHQSMMETAEYIIKNIPNYSFNYVNDKEVMGTIDKSIDWLKRNGAENIIEVKDSRK